MSSKLRSGAVRVQSLEYMVELARARASGSFPSYVIYRPGLASSGLAVATPDEIHPFIERGAGCVYVDSSFAPAAFPDGFVLSCNGFVGLAAYRNVETSSSGSQLLSPDSLTVEDGALIKDPAFFRRGATFTFDCTTRPGLVFETFNSIFVIEMAAVLLGTHATVPACTVTGGAEVDVQIQYDGILGGQPGVPFLQAGLGSHTVALVYSEGTLRAQGLGSEVGGTSLVGFDASAGIATPTEQKGTYIPIPLTLESQLAFTVGTTGQRPASPRDGQPYFDTTLGFQINALHTSITGWVNSAGVPV